MLGALVCAVLLFVAALVVFVFREAWPSFAHNGLAWFGPGGNVDQQLEDDLHLGQPAPGPRLHVPRLAADLGHDR